VVFKIFKCSFNFLKCLQKCGPSEKRAGNCHVSADRRREMLLKVVGQAPANAQKV
jgi:hypothetical protein